MGLDIRQQVDQIVDEIIVQYKAELKESYKDELIEVYRERKEAKKNEV